MRALVTMAKYCAERGYGINAIMHIEIVRPRAMLRKGIPGARRRLKTSTYDAQGNIMTRKAGPLIATPKEMRTHA
jgi:hypothetical protein